MEFIELITFVVTMWIAYGYHDFTHEGPWIRFVQHLADIVLDYTRRQRWITPDDLLSLISDALWLYFITCQRILLMVVVKELIPIAIFTLTVWKFSNYNYFPGDLDDLDNVFAYDIAIFRYFHNIRHVLIGPMDPDKAKLYRMLIESMAFYVVVAWELKIVDYASYMADAFVLGTNDGIAQWHNLVFGKYLVYKTPNLQYIRARYNLTDDHSDLDLTKMLLHTRRGNLFQLPKFYFGAAQTTL